MILKHLTYLLIGLMMVGPVCAITSEANVQPNFWQEADITFWQTMPFVTFWAHFLDKQVSLQLALAGAPHWETILAFATAVSVANAVLSARQAVSDERTGHHH